MTTRNPFITCPNMIAVSHMVTPEKLNEKQKKINQELQVGPTYDFKSAGVLQTQAQLTRKKNRFYKPQAGGLKQALLAG